MQQQEVIDDKASIKNARENKKYNKPQNLERERSTLRYPKFKKKLFKLKFIVLFCFVIKRDKDKN